MQRISENGFVICSEDDKSEVKVQSIVEKKSSKAKKD